MSVAPVPPKILAFQEFKTSVKGLIERGHRAIDGVEKVVQQKMREVVRLEWEINQRKTAHEALIQQLEGEIAKIEAKIAKIEAFLRDEVETRQTLFNGVDYNECYQSLQKVIGVFHGKHQHPCVTSDGRKLTTTGFTELC